MSDHIQEYLMKQIEEERNSVKIAELGRKLNEAMLSEEREKVKSRLGIAADGGKASVRFRRILK